MQLRTGPESSVSQCQNPASIDRHGLTQRSGEGGLWALGLPGKVLSKGGDLGQVQSIMDEKNPEKQKQKPLQLSRIHIY